MNEQVTPSEFLKNKIYPDLDQALIKLIEYVSKTDNIIRHQEHLIEQKILDKFEQKKIQKEKDKKELGVYYESSEESGFDEDFKKNEDDAAQNDNFKSDNMLLDQELEFKSNEEDLLKNSKSNNLEPKKNKFGMIVIEEGDEGDDPEIIQQKIELDEKTKFANEMAKRKKEFNPLKYLGESLKKMAEERKKQR